MRSTITEALALIRALHDVNAGRLRGLSLRYRHRDVPPLGELPDPWRTTLTNTITARINGGIVDADTPEYLVYSDHLVVAWLTAHAQVVCPDLRMSVNQAKHQRMAATALGDLHRWVLAELADRRDATEGRTDSGQDEPERVAGGRIRVAPTADPTRSRWANITGEVPTSQRAVRRALGVAGDVVILAAPGYGRYAHHRHRLDLPMLCALHTIAAAHRVSLATVGDWLDAEGATKAQPGPEPQTVIDAFNRAYLGSFDSRHAYTSHYLHQQGWSTGIRALGIPERYLDIAAIEHDLFSHHVRDIHPDGRRVEVLRRHPSPHQPGPLPPPAAATHTGTAQGHREDRPTRRAGGVR